jgi:hypothetical protein
MTTSTIEVIFFDGCPNVQLAVDRAREAIEAMGTDADVHLVRIDDDRDALEREFLGSPTVRVDGSDVDPSARGRTDFGMQCRVYAANGRLEGAPPRAWIEAALHGAVPIAQPPTTNAPVHDCCGVAAAGGQVNARPTGS